MKVSDDPELCPIARALHCVGDSWTLLILRDAFQGATRFDTFQRDLGIASNMLTRRLERMVANGLLEKFRYQDRPARFEYRLTLAGRELLPVLLTLYRWGELHRPISQQGLQLVDRDTRAPIAPVVVDARSGDALTLSRLTLCPGPDATPAMHRRAERMQSMRAHTTPNSAETDAAAPAEGADAARRTINDR
ncbi:winged helix-turn-helix transcriptional regulator [Salinicola aestuarinus]|uniref:winged helix-turn-helix transcriptional regulator n=1 Tax=Salinicola aestuarinus TaxID=1949082 RepID=UPI000DA1CF73|nr:helix-turn-helix domain-containing protein [Salinicola aestuarinus]